MLQNEPNFSQFSQWLEKLASRAAGGDRESAPRHRS
jgi:hypothetical protein